jgi:hypothetical protein
MILLAGRFRFFAPLQILPPPTRLARVRSRGEGARGAPLMRPVPESASIAADTSDEAAGQLVQS